MAADSSQQKTVIRKDFWSDGLWYGVFLFIPLAFLWIALVGVLAYGASNDFFGSTPHIRAGIFFIFFAVLGVLGLWSFLRGLWSFLTEKFVFTDDQIFYQGFGQYSLLYHDIRRITLRERKGPFGKERVLVFVGSEYGNERLYVIPRWKSLSKGVLASEIARRTRLNLLDQGLLSYYVPSHRREWVFPAFVAGSALMVVGSFLLARLAPEETAGPVVFFWLILGLLIPVFFFWYVVRKQNVILGM